MRANTKYIRRRGIALFVAIAVLGIAALVGEPSQALTDPQTHRRPPTSWRRTPPHPESPLGEWRLARGVHMTEEQRRELERLESIGYLAGYEEAPPVSGVTIYDESSTWDGLNLYVSGDSPGTILMDMDGNVLHEWRFEFDDAWPDYRKDDRAQNASSYWFRAHLFENGDVLAIFTGLGLIKVDKDSNLLWKYFDLCHHDVYVTNDGRVYVLTRKEKVDERYDSGVEIFEDAITLLSPDGEPLKRVSIFDAFWNSDYASMIKAPLARLNTRTVDIFHTNRLELLDGSLSDQIPSFQEGNFLISCRNLNAVAVVDMDKPEVVWAKSGLWLQQHCSTMLDNDHILLFDNQGNYGSSRVVEYDPVEQDIAWLYAGDSENDFYSEKSGAVQRLPNGNTLISESNFGRAFEVTPDGTIVWEYLNPARAGENDELVASLFEMTRLSPDFPTEWLE